MWDLLLDEEQSMIVDSVREYLAREFPIDHLRPNAAPIDADRVYSGMVELGWYGIGLPEDVGGSGLGLVAEMLVQRECGRYLVSPRVVATVLGAHVALEAGDGALSSDLVAGRRAAVLAVEAAPCTASSARVFVFDRGAQDLVLAWNRTGMGLFEPAELTAIRSEICLDDSLAMESGDLGISRPKYRVPSEQSPLSLRAEVLLSAALVGLAEHASELTVGYARVREQFGRPIGSFQAVKHRAADMGIRARLAWYQTCMAGLKVQAGMPDAPAQAAAAKFLAAQAAHENGRAAIQLHGGIGFQAECDVHWFMKRAHVYDHAGGSMKEQARRLAREPSPFP